MGRRDRGDSGFFLMECMSITSLFSGSRGRIDMTFDEQIEAAWKECKPEALVTNSMVVSHDVFAAGYRAALNHIAGILYVEVKESRLDHAGEYYVLRDGEWRFYRAIEIGDGRFNFVGQNLNEVCPASEAERIVFESGGLPSPSEVFGEEVG